MPRCTMDSPSTPLLVVGDAARFQIGGKFLGEEGFPFVRDRLAIQIAVRIPVGVKAGLPADRHDQGDVVAAILLESVGLETPCVSVVACS